MPRLHLPVGLPGSGKSTVSRALAARGAAHVELDAHRRRVWPDCPPSWDPYAGRGLLVQEAFEAEIAGLLAAGRDVVADRTNLHPEGIRRLQLLAPQARLTVHELSGVPLAVCIARDAARPVAVRVGELGIRLLWARWLAPQLPSPAPTVRPRAPGRHSRPPGASSPLLGPPGATQGRPADRTAAALPATDLAEPQMATRRIEFGPT